MLVDVDKTLQDFRKNLTSYGLGDEVTIMIFSDHGMTNITFVNITDTIDYSDIKVMFSTVTFLCIWPEEGKLNKVSVHLHKVSYNLAWFLRPSEVQACLYFGRSRGPGCMLIASALER